MKLSGRKSKNVQRVTFEESLEMANDHREKQRQEYEKDRRMRSKTPIAEQDKSLYDTYNDVEKVMKNKAWKESPVKNPPKFDFFLK